MKKFTQKEQIEKYTEIKEKILYGKYGRHSPVAYALETTLVLGNRTFLFSSTYSGLQAAASYEQFSYGPTTLHFYVAENVSFLFLFPRKKNLYAETFEIPLPHYDFFTVTLWACHLHSMNEAIKSLKLDTSILS